MKGSCKKCGVRRIAGHGKRKRFLKKLGKFAKRASKNKIVRRIGKKVGEKLLNKLEREIDRA